MAFGVTRARIWMFFHRRAVARGDQGHSEDIRVATGTVPIYEYGVSLQTL